MPVIEKIVGQPCSECGEPYVAGKPGKGAYCKPCYINWKEAQDAGQSPAPQAAQPTSKDEVWERKDRTSVAQTSINAAAHVHEGRNSGDAAVISTADMFYSWITGKRDA